MSSRTRRRPRRKGEEESPEYTVLKTLRARFISHAKAGAAPHSCIVPVARWLAEQMEEEQLFDAVVLSDTQLGPAVSTALVTALRETYESLLHLALWRTSSGPAIGAPVGDLIRASERLVSVELVDVGLGSCAGPCLGDALQANASLRALVLDHNPGFGTRGLVGLSKGLRWNETLTRLSLRFTGLDPHAGYVLGSKILPVTPLTSLDVYGNALGAAGLYALVKGLPDTPALAELVAGDNDAHNPPHKVYARLADVLPRATSLTTLDISGHLLSDAGARVLLDAFRDAPSPVSLNITDRIDAQLAEEFATVAAVHAKAAGKRKRRRKKKKA